MIYDTVENLNQYKNLFEHLDTAIDYIEKNDINDLPIGRTDIDGDNVFVMISEVETMPSAEKNFEVHSKYMDLQMDLQGTEICEVSLSGLTEIKPYDEENDCALFESELSAALVMGEGRFAVFMVEEPHKPNVRAEGFEKVKKAVFKVAY